jgi:hypothetical protein
MAYVNRAGMEINQWYACFTKVLQNHFSYFIEHIQYNRL